MVLSEYDVYIDTIDEIENRIVDDTKYPVVRDNKIKRCCRTTLEIVKIFLKYLKMNIHNAEKEKE